MEDRTTVSSSEPPSASASDHVIGICDPLLIRFASSYVNGSDDALPVPVTCNSSSLAKAEFYGIEYRVVASLCIGVLLVFGLVGNVMVILVVLKIQTMHTSTNCYLVSLALADLLLLTFASIPTLVECFLIVDQYVFGSVGCSLMVFAQYLAINVSSLSMIAFTVERYVAVRHPMRIQSLCTVRRAKRIIGGLWMFGVVYCGPWMWLATTTEVPLAKGVSIHQCTFKLPRNQYVVYYMADLLVFYVLPLIATSALYALIARTLYADGGVDLGDGCPPEPVATRADRPLNPAELASRPFISRRIITSRKRNRVQVIKMLAVVFFFFAVLWLPYRSLVVYNSFSSQPLRSRANLLFCRVMVYLNSAINPVLYNALSIKFRRAFLRLLHSLRGHPVLAERHLIVYHAGRNLKCPVTQPGNNVDLRC